NGVFYVYSIGLLKRSIPALDGSYRSRHSRYDRRRDGFSAHSVLRVEAEGFTYDCRDDHCVVLFGSTYFSAIIGPGIGSLRPPADSFDQSVCIDGRVLRIRFCECDVAIVPVPDCARSWRRHHRCSSSIRQRYGSAGRPRTIAWLAFGRHECRNDARAGDRFVRHILGPPMARHPRRLSMLDECALRVEVASRIQTATYPWRPAQAGMARRLVGPPQSNRHGATADADLCRSDVRILLSHLRTCALSRDRVRFHGEDHRLCLPLHRRVLRSHAFSLDWANRGPDR